MTGSKIVALIGGALLAGGLVFAFIPVKVGGESCGSAFHGSSSVNFSEVSAPCDDKRSTFQPVAWGVIVASTILALGGLLTGNTIPPSPKPEKPWA